MTNPIRVVRICWPLVAAMLGAVPAHAQSLDKEIESLENGLCTTGAERGTATAAVWSEDFVQIGPAGQLDYNKVGFPSLTSSAPAPCRNTAIVIRDDAALATGVRTEMPDVRFLHVWHREKGKWMIVLTHLTPIVRAPDGHRLQGR